MAADEHVHFPPFAGVRRGDDDDPPASAESTARMFQRVTDAIAAVGRMVETLAAWDDALKAELDRQAQELVEIRGELVALSNRIESTNRVLASRTDHLA